MMKFLKLSIITIVVILSVVSVGVGYAQISIQPLTIEDIGKRGEVISKMLTVRNLHEYNICVSIESHDWLKLGIPPKEWLKIDPVKFVLKPKETKLVKCRITIPKDAKDELMAMVFVSSVKEGQMGGVGLQIGVPFYAIVKETVSLNPEIIDCVIVTKKKEVKGFVKLKNDSNIHIRPKVKVVVESNEKGKEFRETFKVKYGIPILAGEEKDFTFEEKDVGMPCRKVKATVIMDYGNIIGEKKILEKTFDIDVEEVRKVKKKRAAPKSKKEEVR